MSELETNITDLIVLYFKDEINEEQQKKLDRWLEDDHNKQLFEKILDKEGILEKSIEYDAYDIDKAWQSFTAKNFPNKRVLPVLLRYAAAIVIPVLLAVSSYLWFVRPVDTHEVTQVVEPGKPRATLVLGNGEQIDLENCSDSIIALAEGTHLQKRAEMLNYQDADIQHEIFNTLRIPRGGEYFLILSDGTKIWLNSDTELRYPVKFLSDSRDIYLKGEIYLEVAQNKEKPFIVHANNSSIEVLGTQFNVKAYEDEDRMEATLIEGSVLLDNNSLASVVLNPGEQGVIEKGIANIDVHEVQTSLYTAWKDGLFRFKSLSLGEIMKRFERWYDIDVVYEDLALKDLHFTGNLERYENINPHLELINMTTHVDFEMKDNKLIVSRR